MKNKSCILLISLILFSLSASLQELKQLKLLSKPKKLESDVVARRDQNGNYCAAIQVVSDMDGFSYDSNDGLVGVVDDNPGMDIVYLTRTERVLEVFNRGYKHLEIVLIEHGISLKSGQIWQIEIGGEGDSDKVLVVFKTTPADASIFIDNIPINGNSGNIPVGQHSLVIKKKGYTTIEKDIVVDKNHVYFVEKLEKVLDAILQVESIPTGVSVFINDSLLGETPISVFYPPGKYPVKIEKEGYDEPIFDTIIIEGAQTRKIFNLDENVCYLTVNTIPGANVYFNDVLMKNLDQVKLEPQSLKLRVEFLNSDPIERQLLLKRDDNIVIDLFPSVKTGSLQVTVVPFNAKIELISSNCEIQSAKGGYIFDELLTGCYTIIVKAHGYNDYRKVIEITADDKVNHVAKLNRMANGDFDVPFMDMIFVKGGTFKMGCTNEQAACSDDEKPVHEVALVDFYLAKYEVTQKEWIDIMGYNPSVDKTCEYLPVHNVSFQEVMTFIKKLNRKTSKKYRLPTEAEWEFAARGGMGHNNQKYSGDSILNNVGWYDANSQGKIHTVGHKESNELGIFDLSGNVWEICYDFYNEEFYKQGPVLNPKCQQGHYRVMRGGSYFYPSNYSRVTARSKVKSDYADFNIGFRLALTP